MMCYRISKNEKNLFFGKKIAQVWAVTLSNLPYIIIFLFSQMLADNRSLADLYLYSTYCYSKCGKSNVENLHHFSVLYAADNCISLEGPFIYFLAHSNFTHQLITLANTLDQG